MNAKVVIIFSYTGYQSGSAREKHFWTIVETAKSRDHSPIVVLNEDTVQRGGAVAFLADPRSKGLIVTKTWSVDTCQMWLHGWGYVYDHFPAAERIVQLPGDIDMVESEQEFLNRLKLFMTNTAFDICIGDFSIGDRFSTKALIDEFGTYPLMLNWFPGLTQAILKKSLFRPRSEFLNLDTSVLRDLLKARKFAYEQTINLLIGAWDFDSNIWKNDVIAVPLGNIKDDTSQRNYMTALDQIERLDRLLRLRWREVHLPRDEADYLAFFKRYHQLEQSAESIREAAGITIQGLLGLGLY